MTKINAIMISSLFAYFILMNIAYLQIADKFDYLDFRLRSNITLIELLFNFLALMVSLCVLLLRRSVARVLFFIMQILIMIPNTVVYLWNPLIKNDQILVYILFSLICFAFFKIAEGIKIEKKLFLSKSLFLAFMLLLFFFLLIFYDRLDIRNIFLNVYDVRLSTNYSGAKWEAYFFAFITKFLIPVLAVVSIRKRKYLLFVLLFMLVLLSFTLGNVKSVLFGFFLGIMFAKADTYNAAIKILSVFILMLTLFAVLEDWALESYILNDYFIRRVFLFPPVLASYFFDYFGNNWLDFSHILGLDQQAGIPLGYSVSKFIGEFHMPYFTNPSSGVAVQGYANLGVLGACLFAMIWAILMSLIIMSDVPPYFTGLVFYICYLSNTAFLSTLLFTHGLVFGLLLLTLIKIKEEAWCDF